jgi:5-(carboxyamino)imidazole ribonucleotide synthase
MNKSYFSSDFTLGILGGGQLGKMLLTKTRDWDIRTAVLDPSPNAPARISCNSFEQGSLTDFDTVYAFGKKVDVLTIEIENVNVDALIKLQEEGLDVYPKPETLNIIKNKGRQKTFYQERNIPTSAFSRFANKAALLKHTEEQSLSFPIVWKSEEGGYDGRGVQVLKNLDQLKNLPDTPSILEEFVPFDKEIAVIVARTPSGQATCFPVVEMEFHPEANMVEYVFSPSTISDALQQKAKDTALRVVKEMDHVGLLAVELFVTSSQGILVNEVAPRVHNSGHLSIEGNSTSQFEQHLRAILDLPLGDTAAVKPSVMVNLNGAEGFEGPVHYAGMEEILAMSDVHVHLYGKAETRPFRKMGHVTALADTLDQAVEKAKRIKSDLIVESQKN